MCCSLAKATLFLLFGTLNKIGAHKTSGTKDYINIAHFSLIKRNASLI